MNEKFRCPEERYLYSMLDIIYGNEIMKTTLFNDSELSIIIPKWLSRLTTHPLRVINGKDKNDMKEMFIKLLDIAIEYGTPSEPLKYLIVLFNETFHIEITDDLCEHTKTSVLRKLETSLIKYLWNRKTLKEFMKNKQHLIDKLGTREMNTSKVSNENSDIVEIVERVDISTQTDNMEFNINHATGLTETLVDAGYNINIIQMLIIRK